MSGTLRSLLGHHALRMRRIIALGAVGVVAFLVALPALDWELAALIGWDAAALLFLAVTWRLIARADATETRRIANIEDESRRTSALVIVIACVASLIAIAFTLAAAKGQHGADRNGSVIAAFTTVVLSWLVLHTLYTLRYADVHYRSPTGVAFAGPPGEDPDYRDFAYLSFTIGMCYQVSDQVIRDRRLRRTVLVHALVSYVFGVAIIASVINVVAGLVGT
ncbi:MAG TPA: DUF1345 domain-containing protein [Ilumatobacteraceae bacterium]|nr:DUF1345 domain-containing protein [Ilumatobacteraceae bacterium]